VRAGDTLGGRTEVQVYFAQALSRDDNLGPDLFIVARDGIGPWHLAVSGDAGAPDELEVASPDGAQATVDGAPEFVDGPHVDASYCGAPLPIDSTELAVIGNVADADARGDLLRVIDKRSEREDGFFCPDCFENEETVDRDTPPSDDEVADRTSEGRWAQFASPSGRYRVIAGWRYGALPRWWLLDGTTVVSMHRQQIVRAVAADSGECLIVRPLNETEHEICDFTAEGACRFQTVLEDRPFGVAFDTVGYGGIIAQLNWVPVNGTRPDLDRRVYAWLLGPEPTAWTAQARFPADKITIRRGQVSFRSYRYGTTILRLADGFLLSDTVVKGIDLTARPPTYPGIVAGARSTL
jgi:hypothetical protein